MRRRGNSYIVFNARLYTLGFPLFIGKICYHLKQEQGFSPFVTRVPDLRA